MSCSCSNNTQQQCTCQSCALKNNVGTGTTMQHQTVEGTTQENNHDAHSSGNENMNEHQNEQNIEHNENENNNEQNLIQEETKKETLKEENFVFIDIPAFDLLFWSFNNPVSVVEPPVMNAAA